MRRNFIAIKIEIATTADGVNLMYRWKRFGKNCENLKKFDLGKKIF